MKDEYSKIDKWIGIVAALIVMMLCLFIAVALWK